MGCFLACFRIKDDESRRCHLFSKICSLKKRDLVVDRNQYSSVASFEVEERGTPSGKAELELEENFDGDDSVQKLREEAKFLKTCGAILETPIEIRKGSVQQSVASDPCSIKINWDQQLDKSDDPPTKDPETIFEDEKLKSYKQEENNNTTTKKMVRFEELNPAPLDISPQTENQMQPNGPPSPYPTPTNLADEIQTPGTIYPPKPESFRTGLIRAQFVYPVPTHSQRTFESNVSCESTEKVEIAMDFGREASVSDKSPEEDRPIIGAASAHWSDEESSRISPKQWDGNGIPNSTTKYKEDQKVSWHATPFEVRLEKALSDEKVYPPRKVDGRLMGLEEEESVSIAC